MWIVGLTGGIASGKSSVSRLLKELGAWVVDADQLARVVVARGEPAWMDIVSWLGSPILLPDGELDRRQLGELIFTDPVARQRLGEITHPRIQERVRQAVAEGSAAGAAVVVLDVPLLFESQWQPMVDAVWVVYVDPDVQIERLMARDSLSLEQALQRVNAQMNLRDKAGQAQVVIDNNFDWEKTCEQVRQAWQDLQK